MQRPETGRPTVSVKHRQPPARQTGETSLGGPCAIRYYEAERLLQPPQRQAKNYRSYTQAHVDRLYFIVRFRSLDMAQEEIRTLLKLLDEPSRPCDEVDALLKAHLQHVNT
jgi:DNA-binding transcriptional MerR regulator